MKQDYTATFDGYTLQVNGPRGGMVSFKMSKPPSDIRSYCPDHPDTKAPCPFKRLHQAIREAR